MDSAQDPTSLTTLVDMTVMMIWPGTFHHKVYRAGEEKSEQFNFCYGYG